MEQDYTSPLQFHWCLASTDSGALESAARSGIFESVMLEPVLTSRAQIEAALDVARDIPDLRLTIPIRYDAVTANELLSYATDRRNLWNVICARLPFVPRHGAGSGSDWYRIANAFLREFRALPGGSETAPIHLYGNSSEAAVLAIKYADCLWRFAAGMEDTYSAALPMLHFGKEVGIVAGLAVRPQRDDARKVVGDTQVEWLSRTLCRAPEWPVNAPILAGSYQDAAESIIAWKRLGISQFLFAAPRAEREMEHFLNGVLPLVREKEAGEPPSAKEALSVCSSS
jgi:hypothetical protein